MRALLAFDAGVADLVAMRLPSVDVYREPFIAPLGHLVMFSAKADNELVRLVCAARGESVPANQVAHKLRNWGEPAKSYVLAALREVTDPDLRAQAIELVEQFERLRERRHRCVHDAVEVGVFGSEVVGYEVRPLHVGFVRQDRDNTFENIVEVTADEIASLAFAYADLASELEARCYMLSQGS